jgi:protein-S-isoprenylcysteine O-methyltransferase Ste14
MEIIKPDGKLDADVIDEILRVKERTARSRERRDWAAISASALGVVLLAAAIATAVMSGGSSEGASPASLVMVAVGGLLVVVGGVILVLSFRADAQAFLSGGRADRRRKALSERLP